MLGYRSAAREGVTPVTEAEWMACTDPDVMLDFLFGKGNSRKLWLFGVACCRRIWHLLEDRRGREAVEVVERWADGLASEAEMVAAYKDADDAADCSHGGPALAAYDLVAAANVFDAVTVVSRRAAGVTADAADSDSAAAVENVGQVSLLHDIFGSLPFHPVTIDPSWLGWNGGTIPKLAEAIYDDRRFSDLPILADALEEAGCTDADILSHCRSGGEHVRGCWVIDLLLGKE
jgi:hypothetical protein